MIFSVEICVKDLEHQGKFYPWERPNHCPRCKGKLWGHGYVLRYFFSCPNGVYLKRWRCPACRLTLTARPRSFWRRFQESISNIFDSLLYKVRHQKWPPWSPRQRSGHWLRQLLHHAKTHLLMKDSVTNTITFYREKNLVIFEQPQRPVPRIG